MKLKIDTEAGEKTVIVESDMDHNYKTVYTVELEGGSYISGKGFSVEEAIIDIQKKIKA